MRIVTARRGLRVPYRTRRVLTFFAQWAAALLIVVLSPPSSADEVSVPIQKQVELMGKVLPYDKNLAARAGDRLRVLLVSKDGDDASFRAVTQMQRLLTETRVGDLPIEVTVQKFKN